MKIRIIDLMDDYFDDSVKLESPAALEQRRNNRTMENATPAEAPEVRRGKKPLLIAAALLLVVTAAAAGPMLLSRAPEGSAMSEGATPETTPELDIFGASELEGQTQEPNVAADAPEPEAAPAEVSAYAPLMMTGEGIGRTMDGKLLLLDGTYYAMTDTGAEPVELQWVETTVECYGTWNVNFGYAVIDGELAIHSKNAVVTEGGAKATAIPGSTDTVLLTFSRTGVNEQERCAYPVVYNFVTGEISDPLAGVPDLFSYGDVMTTQFNDSMTRAIVNVLYMPYGGGGSYVCDLTTGTMTNLEDIVIPLISVPGLEGDWGTTYLYSSCLWTGNDTLMGCAGKSASMETISQRLDQGWDPDDARENWGCAWAYDFAAGTLVYQKEDVETGSAIIDFNQSTVYSLLYRGGYPDATLQIANTQTGECGILEGPTFADSWGDTMGYYGSRYVMKADDGNLYLADGESMQWANLSEILTDLPENIAQVEMVTADWVLLYSGSGSDVYCYHISGDIPMNPLTAQ